MSEAIYIIVGLVLLFLGGESLLRGSVSLARSYGLSKLLVSAVIIGFGSSMPEMTVSVGAALKNSPDIALGNVIGSNIANILLIVGIAALLSPIHIKDSAIRRDVVWMLISVAGLVVLMWVNALNVYCGALLFLSLLGYIIWSFIQDRAHPNRVHEHMEEDAEPETSYTPVAAFIMCAVGLIALVGGASLLVDGAVSVARKFGISEAIIGLTIVAIGTSLPELATAIVASLKKHSDVVVGNILGSNIFNILAILGVTSMIKPIPVSPHLMHIDVWVMAAACIALSVLLVRKMTIGKLLGGAMLASYIGYSTWLYVAL